MTIRTPALVAAILLVGMPIPGPAEEQPITPGMKAFQLKCIDATKLTRKLGEILGISDEAIASDGPSNTVFIKASPRTLRQAKYVLDLLDCRVSRCITVIRLERTNAAAVAGTLSAFLQVIAVLEGDFYPIRVSVAGEQNQILIQGSDDRMRQAKLLIEWLDGKVRLSVILSELGAIRARLSASYRMWLTRGTKSSRRKLPHPYPSTHYPDHIMRAVGLP